MARQVVCNKAEGFTYGGAFRYNGEVFDLRGFPNDGRLITLGYVVTYDDSQHDKSDEREELGRKFISDAHRLSFLRQLGEREEDEAIKMRRRNMTADDERQMEHVALERMGLQMHENRGARVYTRGATQDPVTELCPIEGCEEQVELLDLRAHVAGHGSTIAAPPKAERRKPGPKPGTRRPSAAAAV